MTAATGRKWDLGRWEGWRAFVESDRRQPPDPLTATQLAALSTGAREEYDDRRRDYHANFGVIQTPQLLRSHELLDVVFDTGLRVDDDRVKPSVVIDAPAGVGKTTAVNEYLRLFERAELAKHGAMTDAGQLRIPVCRIGMTAKAGLKPLTSSLLRFYGNPTEGRAYTRSELYDIIKVCVRECETHIIAIDDVHFVDPHTRDGLTVSNFFKGWTNDLGVGLVMAGVGLAGRGLYSDGHASAGGTAQNGRRWTPISMGPYLNRGKTGKREWKALIAAYETHIVLANHEPMDIVNLADRIHARTQGYLVSLNHLMTRAAVMAIRRGTERITADLLDEVPLDYEAQTYWEKRSQSNLAS